MSDLSSTAHPSFHPAHPRPKFGENDGFQATLRHRVEEFFQRTGKRQRDCWQMYVKTGLILAAFALCYTILVFFAHNWWQAGAAALLLGCCAGLIGFNI